MTLIAGAALLAVGLLLKNFYTTVPMWGTIVLLAAFLAVAAEVLLQALNNIRHGDIFGESFLMAIAGIGAVIIGEIPEGVMVFLLYRLGEYLQTKAVSSSRKSISALLDVRPDRANLLENGVSREVEAEEVAVGQTILVRPGEKIPLDGVVLEGSSQLDTAALTGESVPRDIAPGQQVMAGCINLSGALEIRVEKSFGESTASKILEMVEHASEKKAASEKFITRFARIYTPIVCLAAVVVAVLPPLVGLMAWERSIYSALCFLVISCPCALVISVPLSFFAGIGRASREGVLVKGGNHLETLAEAQIVAFDKTGTLTEGRFSVSDCLLAEGISREKLLELAALAECRSTHPIAQSILAAHGRPVDGVELEDYQEVSGHGVSVKAEGHRILAGKRDYLLEAGISLPEALETAATTVYVAEDGIYRGAVLLRDAPKKDAKSAIEQLRQLGIQKTAMLSGDSKSVVAEIAREIGLDQAAGELLPQEKLAELEKLRGALTGEGKLLYAGDGINDTPVLAAADIGIAMGGLGADAAIETADVIIMGDEPGKIAAGIRIARRTKRIAAENIVFAIAVKVLVMLLSVLGHVELWAGVFADVGVCMLCVLNTLRINQK
ncbi:MAG: cadmium-translocating P-type ATPase [Oscillospiraceae bacterium]|nr:cadmium-translocating P-type ATPase [Oscillospiraceae bacterium]